MSIATECLHAGAWEEEEEKEAVERVVVRSEVSWTPVFLTRVTMESASLAIPDISASASQVHISAFPRDSFNRNFIKINEKTKENLIMIWLKSLEVRVTANKGAK